MSITANGLSVLYSPAEADTLADFVDESIVFVHGLQGHPRNTWTARPSHNELTSKKNSRRPGFLRWLIAKDSRRQSTNDGRSDDSVSSQGDAVFWPLDLLPEDCPDCRVLTFGYDSLVTKFFAGPANQNSIHGHSKNLLYALGRSRRGCVLRRAAIDEDADLLDIRNATKAFIFLGTPHRGSSMAPWGETVRKIVAISGFNTNDKNIRALHIDSTELEVSREDFIRQWRRENFIVRTFQESLVMDVSSSLDDPREHAEHINANHREMCRFTGKDDPGYRQVGGELCKIVDTLRHERQEEVEERLSSEELECLRSLCVPEVDMWEHKTNPDVQTSCTWLFNLQEYRSWKDLSDLQTKTTLLRVKGKLGTGKSTSIKVALSKLWSEDGNIPDIKLAFFFNNRGTPLEKSQLGLFRSLLFQLFRQSKQILKRFMPNFRQKADFYNHEWTWNQEELKDFFMSVMTELSPSSAYIFIDALHECEESRDIITFFESLRATALQKRVSLRICYSSRHYPPIQVGNYVELHIDAHNSDDIENYIERKLEPMFRRRHIDKLKSYIIEKAQGVFLWVVLIINKIIKANDNGESMKKMQQMVEVVPDKLEALYKETLESVKVDHPVETLLVLQWTLCASRPITLLELRYALAFQNCGYKSQAEAENCLSFIESDQQMDLLHRSRTGNLTETRTQKAVKTAYARQIFDLDNQETVHFVHDSVRSFLLKHGGLQLFDSSATEEALCHGHHQLAEACINYLNATELRRFAESHSEADTLGLTKSVELFKKICWLFPFLHYSIHSVFEHIVAARTYQSDEKGRPSYLYQRMKEVFPVWRYFSDLDNKSCFHELHDPSATLTHLAVEYNLIDWVKDYISNGGDVNLEGGRFGTFLQAAAGMGHEEMVDLLLDHGADIHICSGRLGSALSAATSEGNLSIVKTLIQRGSNVNEECGEYGCALQAAVCSPNGSRELTRTLLDAGADIHMQNGTFGTVLQAAARKGDEETVQILLACGADINIRHGKYGTALGAAAAKGYEKIVQVFLELGADPAADAGDYGNSIWAAAYNGRKNVLRQILRHHWPSWGQEMVESKAQDILSEASRTKAFHEAVENGDLDLAKKFIEDGIDPNSMGGAYSSALHTAVIYGHVDIVDLLLAQERIKVDVSDFEGRTPLWRAASDGHLEIAKKLLATGQVDGQHKSNSKRNLLWYAAYDGRMDMIRLMLEAGADPYEADMYGQTPIMAAEEGGQKEAVLFLQGNVKK
ncbi:uncharacterized protein GIQ15_04401 [Arthroderma uncinatum]|uniref:uncharacterized protein n=1 Tax=Arthroderma uncinatum TaxID=74035 RepID=UPI00144AF5B3|nr:uncharacterized protein GIQ15_04401 [Arthroderma uncinatum]KAF3481642.1 hypothetical protein GIQ15_04401 [Arthroderma uncinatum]